MEVIKELLEFLEKNGGEERDDEDGDFDPQDYSGGNFDDCYQMGKDDGSTELANDILLMFGDKLRELVK